MGRRFPPLDRQTMVITGATSGIGLITAREAARAGAKLSLTARNEPALQKLCEELREAGGEAIYTVADVGVEDDVRRLADATIEHFDGFDTWVNDAAVAIYGKLEDISIEDQRRLFDTNFWGMVYGSRIACQHLRQRGGKLINLGSALSDRAIPIQGIYSASKAAVMGYTDALRMELEQDGAPVSVSLIKPGAIDSPYKDHAANYLGVAGKNPPPVYAPDTVARAILHAATHDIRDAVVGGGSKAIDLLGNLAPRLTDRLMARTMPRLQRTDQPIAGIPKGSLYEPGEDLQERGDYPVTFEHSAYSALMRHKSLLAMALAAGALALYLSQPRQMSR